MAKDEQRFTDPDQYASPGEYPKFNLANGWIVYDCDRCKRLTVERICECVRGVGRTALGVGSTTGNCNAAWTFQHTPPTAAFLKTRSSGKDEQRFAYTNQQRSSPGEYPRFNSANGWIVYKSDSE